MRRIRRTFTRTETLERLLVFTRRTETTESCRVCPGGAGWLPLNEAALITGSSTELISRLRMEGVLHSRYTPEDGWVICAASLVLKLLKGEKDNETPNI